MLLEKGMATHSSILACKTLWRVSLAGYSPWGHEESDITEHTHIHTHTHTHTEFIYNFVLVSAVEQNEIDI